MEGYDVISSDDSKMGHVVGRTGDFLIVEHGAVFKSRHLLPTVFAHVDESEGIVRATISKRMLETSPKVHGEEFDQRAVCEHYGLAGAATRPDTKGYGELNADDPAISSERQAQRDGVVTAEQERLAVQRAESAPDKDKDPHEDQPTHRPIPYI